MEGKPPADPPPSEPDVRAATPDEDPPRASPSDADDPYGPEPAWLQGGSGRRSLWGIGLTLVLLIGVGAVGWWLFAPDGSAASQDKPGHGKACQLTAHDDSASVPQPDKLGSAPDRQTATVETNFGTVTVLLFGDVSPCGVSGFAYLAKQGFYKNNSCYRITTRQEDPTVTLRCGDPTGTGKGGPGFRYRAEDAFNGRSGRDYVALINNSTGQAGSAFAFIRGESKPTAYLSVIGEVIAGHEVLDQIGAAMGNTEYDDKPPVPVTISKITFSKGTVTMPPSDSGTGTVPGGTGSTNGGSGQPGSPSVPPTSAGSGSVSGL
ncbi:MAG TPA: peptidylprolyl isomerase [Stackebrandtia sp.]|jgi:cyclophilin family peptidyl-prolyl cis-trans isomerase|uniref:peptidylprolyl isomerase n=1 Tax=Stackebrandtia sp. TaxID=2023065 RepID=UPI002D7539F9|nr:peptidylprolyl isomerase [Stackebrandtia sp.]HZE40770.1 peptidylprolyl isomerase [Stackebrandtia sp.]